MAMILRTFIFAIIAISFFFTGGIIVANSLNSNYNVTPDGNFSTSYATLNSSVSTISDTAKLSDSKTEGVEIQQSGGEAGIIISIWFLPLLVIKLLSVPLTALNVSADALGIPLWIVTLATAALIFAVIMMVISLARGNQN